LVGTSRRKSQLKLFLKKAKTDVYAEYDTEEEIAPIVFTLLVLL